MVKAKYIWFLILMSLCLTSASIAAPTISRNPSLVQAESQYTSSNTEMRPVSHFAQNHQNCDAQRIAAELFAPPSAVLDNPSVQGKSHTVSLPAVPGSLLMTATGFLCVSLLWNRKTWLSIMIGLLWIGQTGITALPSLASRICNEYHKQKRTDSDVIEVQAINIHKLRIDIDGTSYIGLLHRLAGIPDDTARSSSSTSLLLSQKRSLTTERDSVSAATISSYTKDQSFCFASNIKQLVLFSPAFCFGNLARGPPGYAWRMISLSAKAEGS